MGEGILRRAVGDTANVYSAGSKPVGYVHPIAIQVLSEIGIDISSHSSKSWNEFTDQKIDVVITVCGNADQICPFFPGQCARYHWGFDDPAHVEGTDEHILNEFRRVRDEIRLKFEVYGENVKAGKLTETA